MSDEQPTGDHGTPPPPPGPPPPGAQPVFASPGPPPPALAAQAPPAPAPHAQAPPPPSPGGPLSPHPAAPPPARRRRTGLWIGIAAAVVVLGALAAAVVVFYRPAFVVEAMEAPAEVVAGAEVIMSVHVRNDGMRGGDLELTALVDGQPAETTLVELAAGADDVVRISLRDLAAGTYRLGLADWDDVSGVVWVMTPPEFVVDYLLVEPSPIDVNSLTEATVTVGVSNVGEAPGQYTGSLQLDGEGVDGWAVDLAGGASDEQSFTIVVDAPGDHELRFGDVTQTLTAHALRRPGNGEELVNTIRSGSNELRIRNDADQDVVIILAAPGDDQPALLTVYVRAGASATVYRVSSGTYEMYYVYGTDWCTHLNQFTSDVMAGRFAEAAEFEAGATFFTYYTLEMGRASGSGVPTVPVPLQDVPSM